eukprot:6791488-Pyramimonas_sp.AAC.1
MLFSSQASLLEVVGGEHGVVIEVQSPRGELVLVVHEFLHVNKPPDELHELLQSLVFGLEGESLRDAQMLKFRMVKPIR